MSVKVNLGADQIAQLTDSGKLILKTAQTVLDSDIIIDHESSGGSSNLQDVKNVTTDSSIVVRPDDGYDGMKSVNINVSSASRSIYGVNQELLYTYENSFKLADTSFPIGSLTDANQTIEIKPSYDIPSFPSVSINFAEKSLIVSCYLHISNHYSDSINSYIEEQSAINTGASFPAIPLGYLSSSWRLIAVTDAKSQYRSVFEVPDSLPNATYRYIWNAYESSNSYESAVAYSKANLDTVQGTYGIYYSGAPSVSQSSSATWSNTSRLGSITSITIPTIKARTYANTSTLSQAGRAEIMNQIEDATFTERIEIYSVDKKTSAFESISFG